MYLFCISFRSGNRSGAYASGKKSGAKNAETCIFCRLRDPDRTDYLLSEEQKQKRCDLFFGSDPDGVSVLSVGGGVLKKVTAVICDEEELYCSKLLEYLQRNPKESIGISVCSEKKELIRQLERGGVDLVLMTEDFFSADVLAFESVSFVLLGGGLVSEEYKDYPHILKYQKADEIVRELCRLAGEGLDDRKFFSILGQEKRVVAFYSPHQEFSQMYLAMGYAKICAKKERVLYLNLMECAGFEALFLEEYRENIGDFLFFLRRQEKNLRLRFEGMLHQFGEVDYLPPVFFGEILGEAAKEDYENLLKWLLSETEYNVIVLDIGVMFTGFFDLIGQCSEIYCLTRENQGAKNRYDQFLQCVDAYGGNTLKERIHTVPVAGQCVVAPGKGLMQELEWGEFGDYIRKQFTGGSKIECAGG